MAGFLRWCGRMLVKQVLTVPVQIGCYSKQRGQRSWIFSFPFQFETEEHPVTLMGPTTKPWGTPFVTSRKGGN